MSQPSRLCCCLPSAWSVQAIAAAYDAALRGSSLMPPARRAGVGHVFHLYVLGTPERAAGVTESVLAQSDKSHRVFGSAALSVRPNEWFAAALRLDGRYDWHSGVPDGNGGGGVGGQGSCFAP
jgi:hypothetical protein